MVESVLLGAAEESVLLCRLRGDGAAVQGIDLVGVVGQDLAAAQLHRRRHVAVCDREGGVDDAELTDRLGAGDGLVGAFDGLFEGLAHGGQLRGLGGRALRQAVLGEPIRQHVCVESEERADVGALVAHHDDVGDERVRGQGILEDLGGDVLAACGDDEFLLAPGDGELALAVDGTQVARVEPGAVGHDLGGLLGQVVVAGHDGLAAHEDLAVLGDLDEVPGQRQADAADRVLADVLDGDRAGRLGQAVALDEGDTHARVEVGEIGGQGGAAGDDVAQVGAEHRADLLQDEGVGDAVADLLEGARTEGLLGREGVGACLLGAPREHAPLDAAASLGGGRVVDLLEDAGHDEEHGGLEGLDVGQQVLDGGGEAEHALAGEDDVHDESGEHVGDGKEEQEAGLGGVDDLAEHLACALRGCDEVRVRERHALGVAGRPGGVDDGRDVGRGHGGASAFDVLDGDVRCGARDFAQGALVEGVDREREGGRDRAHELGLLGGGREDAGDVRVGEDVLDLGGGIGLVDRDGDRADGQEREVQEEPLVRGGGEDRDRVTPLDSKADEPTGGVLDLALELAGGQGTRRAHGGALLEGDLLGERGGPLGEHVGDDVVLPDLVGRLDRVGAVTHALHRVLRDVGSKTEQQVRCESTGCGAAPAPQSGWGPHK